MNNPSTVADGGHSVIIPLEKIHATPSKGTIPNTKESTSIMTRKSTSCSQRIQIQIVVRRVHSKTCGLYAG